MLISEARSRLTDGTSHRELERKLGLPNNALKGLLDKQAPRSPGVDKAKEIAEALGWELYVGPRRSHNEGFGETGPDFRGSQSELMTRPRFIEETGQGSGLAHFGIANSYLEENGFDPQLVAVVRALRGGDIDGLEQDDFAVIHTALPPTLDGRPFAYFLGLKDSVRFARIYDPGSGPLLLFRRNGDVTQIKDRRSFRVLGCVVGIWKD